MHAAVTEVIHLCRPAPPCVHSLQCVKVKPNAATEHNICRTCRAAAPSAGDPEPMERKHVQRIICNGKTNPVKDFVDFTARGNGVQLPRVLVTDAFSHLAPHVPGYPPVALNTLNLDAPSPSTCATQWFYLDS